MQHIPESPYAPDSYAPMVEMVPRQPLEAIVIDYEVGAVGSTSCGVFSTGM